MLFRAGVRLELPQRHADVLVGHGRNAGDFVAVLVQQAHIEQELQVFRRVEPDVRAGPARRQEPVALLPRTNRVCLDTGKVLKVLDGKFLHGQTHKRTNTEVDPRFITKMAHPLDLTGPQSPSPCP